MNRKVAVLFARKNSIYKSIPGTDVYDIERDARTYSRHFPIVAHPPCRSWGRCRGLANIIPEEKALALFAVAQVRKGGGVLEHPESSTLWREMNLPLGRQRDEFGGWTLSINQSWFGHKARKKTWLYIVGVEPGAIPDYPITFDAIEYTVGSSKARKYNAKKELSQAGREYTPEQLANWLVKLARLTKSNFYT